MIRDGQQAMGIWRVFGWRNLFRWDVFGVVVPGGFLAVGLAMLGIDWFPRHLSIAQFFLALTALSIVGKTIGHAVQSDARLPSKIGFSLLICLMVVGIAVYSLNQIQKHKNAVQEFAVFVRSAFIEESNGVLSHFVAAYPSILGDTASPIQYLVYLQLVNVDDSPRSVVDIKVSASEEQGGPWEKLVPISLATATLFYVGVSQGTPHDIEPSHAAYRMSTPPSVDDLKTASAILATPNLESQFNALIEPNGDIRGWIALDSLKHNRNSAGMMYLRVETTDSAGKTETNIAELPTKSSNKTALDGDTGRIRIVGSFANLSLFHMRHIGDPFAVSPKSSY